ncbi:hypothetical protein IFM89_038846 [Coptis chinensis]|uniref:H15 domain-containing protein n=1 Tax=Coptis chinensis TaxID=261450 RepID=A0A835I7P0_9MAGN|nr:hypothetical protein IFM89_038846 [Coptis chinensis]
MEEEGSRKAKRGRPPKTGKLTPSFIKNPKHFKPSIIDLTSPSISKSSTPSIINPSTTYGDEDAESALFRKDIKIIKNIVDPTTAPSKEVFRRSYHAKDQPSHPHYSQLVLEAIREQDDKYGSKEETIMKYIESAYNESPIFFQDVLKFTLKSLVDEGEIEVTPQSTYVLPFHHERLRIKESEADPRSIYQTCTIHQKRHK